MLATVIYDNANFYIILIVHMPQISNVSNDSNLKINMQFYWFILFLNCQTCGLQTFPVLTFKSIAKMTGIIIIYNRNHSQNNLLVYAMKIHYKN